MRVVPTGSQLNLFCLLLPPFQCLQQTVIDFQCIRAACWSDHLRMLNFQIRFEFYLQIEISENQSKNQQNFFFTKTLLFKDIL